MVIAETASRNVVFEAAKLAESVFAGQSDFIIRQVATEGLSSDEAGIKTFLPNNDE